MGFDPTFYHAFITPGVGFPKLKSSLQNPLLKKTIVKIEILINRLNLPDINLIPEMYITTRITEGFFLLASKPSDYSKNS